MLSIDLLLIFLGLCSCIFLLIGMGEPAVVSVGRSLHSAFCIRIPISVFCQKFRETVLEIHVHITIDVFLGLVTDLISSYISQFGVFLHIQKVHSVLPLET